MKNLLGILCLSVLAACASSKPFTGYCDLVIPTKTTSSDLKRSMVTEMSSIDDKVENGSAYEKTSFKLPPSIKEICVPKGATVLRSSQGRLVTILLKKELGYAGHPGEFTSIRTERKEMWAAIQIHSKALHIALKGGWDSDIEGGADINLVVFVPAGVKVKWEKNLNFFSDANHPSHAKYQPAEWYVLPTAPDPAHLFDKYAPPAPNS